MPYMPWEDLLSALNTWAVARTVPDGIEVSFSSPSGDPRVVLIVMTRSDWEEMAEVIAAYSPQTVRRDLLALAKEEQFLVSDAGVELVPSCTRELPPDPLDEIAPEPGGQWVTMDDSGNVQSRFADWDKERK